MNQEKTGILLDDYKIENLLGTGSSGVVYKVRHMKLDTLFAVKAPYGLRASTQRAKRLFFREIRTWIDLPQHPNITTCHFVKTWQGKILVFAELVEGGSLTDLVENRKLLNIKDVLDVAIQFAWGLHAAHSQKVVHKDVKPANLLISNENVAKITDFGLARVHELPQESNAETDQIREKAKVKSVNDSTISSGIMTPAFCSPEQNNESELDFRTDIWSYGLTILTMFTGPPNWMSGCSANSILEQLLQKGRIDPYPELPEQLIYVLRKCFQPERENRWKDCAELAYNLIKVYRDEVGEDYFREEPSILIRPVRGDYNRELPGQDVWDDPTDWIRNGLKLAGKEDEDEGLYTVPMEGSHKARAFIDIEMFQEARKLYEEVLGDRQVADSLDKDQRDIWADYALLLTHKASAHKFLKDYSGTLGLFMEARSVFQQLAYLEPSVQRLMQLAMTCNNMARTYRDQNQLDKALDCYNLGIQAYEKIPPSDLNDGDITKASLLFMNKANVFLMSRRFAESITQYELAYRMIKSVGGPTSETDHSVNLSFVIMNKATAHHQSGQQEEALALFEEAVPLLEHLVFIENKRFLVMNLSSSYSNMAVLLRNLDQMDRSIEASQKSIDLMEDAIYRDGKSNLQDSLCVCYLNHGNTLREAGRLQDAQDCFQKCEEALNHLIMEQSRQELFPIMTRVKMAQGLNHQRLGKPDRALQFMDEAIDACNRLLDQGLRHETVFLLTLLQQKAIMYIELGMLAESIEFAYEAYERIEDIRETTPEYLTPEVEGVVRGLFALASYAVDDASDAELHGKIALELMESCNSEFSDPKSNLVIQRLKEIL